MQDFRNSGSTSIQGSITESKIDVTNIAEHTSTTWIVWLTKSQYVNAAWKAYVEFDGSYANIVFSNTSDYHTVKSISLQNGKIAEIPALTEEELADYNQVAFAIPKGSHLTLTQIAPYQGALVGDGVDDYGQCVKDFALPDDYTVVAMRELFNDAGAPIISKSHLRDYGAFIFEANSGKTYSYGSENDVNWPKLFSYQTKNIYNGKAITSGTGTDTEEDKLNIFRFREGNSAFCQAALYSFGIFTRTLTAEELALVEDCMYLELEYNTNILDGVEYYDILDARYRSNEEAEDKRNKWNGRLGKLHLTLNNYAYSEMSGWNGYPGDFSTFTKNSDGTLVSKSQSKVTLKWGSDPWVGMIPYSSFPQGKYAVRVSFSNPNIQSGLFIYYNTETSSSVANAQLTSGINVIDKTLSSQPNYVYVSSAEAKPGDEITLELLPDYGGALVSDGVDDNAVSSEVIDEEIGGFVWHGETLTTGYAFATSWGANHVFMYKSNDGITHYGGKTSPVEAIINTPVQILGFSKAPAIPNATLRITSKLDSSFDYLNAALYQLRLIKTQPTETQLEVIKQQVLREHNDYVKEMG